MKRAVVKTILMGLTHVLRGTARKHSSFREFMGRHNCTAQIRLKDGSIGRYYTFVNGRVSSGPGIHPRPS